MVFILSILGEMGLPVEVLLWLKSRYGARWTLIGVGMLTFIASQVVSIPMLGLMNNMLLYQLPPYDVSYT